MQEIRLQRTDGQTGRLSQTGLLQPDVVASAKSPQEHSVVLGRIMQTQFEGTQRVFHLQYV